MTTTGERLVRLGRSLLGGAWRIGETVSHEWQLAEEESLNRAHLATRADRPAVGCHPCEPADIAVPLKVEVNPPAEGRSS